MILKARSCTFGSGHNKAKGDRWGGGLKGVRADLVAEAEVDIAGGGSAWFLRVKASIQKVDCGNSSPNFRHQIHTEFRELRPLYVTDPVAAHLKDICHWEGRIIEPMLNL